MKSGKGCTLEITLTASPLSHCKYTNRECFGIRNRNTTNYLLAYTLSLPTCRSAYLSKRFSHTTVTITAYTFGKLPI